MGIFSRLFGGGVDKECFKKCMEDCVWSCIKWYTKNDPGVPPNLVRFGCERDCKKACKKECKK